MKAGKRPAEQIIQWEMVCRAMDRGFFFLLLLLMLPGLYAIYDSLYLYGYDPANLSYYIRPDEQDGREVPDGAVGWLTIAGTQIDYPVMQGKDNEEYLNKDPYGRFALAGSVFLDFRNAPDWQDGYNLLYGHHMSADRMFGSLDRFKDRKWFDDHRTGYLKTDRADYELRLFAVVEDRISSPILFAAGEEADAKAIRAYLRKHARIFKEPDDAGILAMTTCQEAGSTSRLLVIASMHEIRRPGSLRSTTKREG